MSVYENQIQATANYFDPETRKMEQNGGHSHSSTVPGNDKRGHEWADVLKELEPYY